MRRGWVAGATPGYMATTTLLTLVILSVPLVISARGGAAPAVLIALAILALVPASELAVTVINQDVTGLVGPRRLAKLGLWDGVPPELSTMVVVPTLLEDEEEIRVQAEQLEVRCLANSDGCVRFALLTDWKDSANESEPDDQRSSSTRQRRRSRSSTRAMGRDPRVRRGSTSSIAAASATTGKASGWGGSASAESSPSSTGCFEARATRRSFPACLHRQASDT